MTEEITPEAGDAVPAATPRFRGKRDIFRFSGEKPTAINLEHVTQMGVDGKRITFQFYNTAMYVDLADDAAALAVLDVLLNTWAGEPPEIKGQ